MASGSKLINFGLKDDEIAVFREMFVSFSNEAGLPGEQIFESLLEGKSIHETLGISDAGLDLIYTLAHQRLSAGQINRARDLFGILTLFVPNNHYYWLGLSISMKMSGDDSGASEALDIIAGLVPKWAVLHYHRLEHHIEAKNWQAAQESLLQFRSAPAQDVSPYMIDRVERFALALAGKV